MSGDSGRDELGDAVTGRCSRKKGVFGRSLPGELEEETTGPDEGASLFSLIYLYLGVTKEGTRDFIRLVSAGCQLRP
jgi:hypothetical protein